MGCCSEKIKIKKNDRKKRFLGFLSASGLAHNYKGKISFIKKDFMTKKNCNNHFPSNKKVPKTDLAMTNKILHRF